MKMMTRLSEHQLARPLSFTVAWREFEEPHCHKVCDLELVPRPVTPLFHTLSLVVTGSVATSGEGARAERLRLAELWETRWRPEIEDHWGFWAAFDLERAAPESLDAHFEESVARYLRLYEIHRQMGPLMWGAIDTFENFYCDLFSVTTPLEAHRLLQGFDSRTREMERALWRLRNLAQASLPVYYALVSTPAERVVRVLELFYQGQAFLDELHNFLAVYGRRNDFRDWGYPSWEEEPAPVIRRLQEALAQPDRDPRAELTVAAARREVAVAEARRRLTTYPAPIVECFEQLLQAAQAAVVLAEERAYYVDYNGFGWMRRVILEIGRRFAAAGRLKDAQDLFYLTLDELRGMLSGAHDFCGVGWADLAAGRRSELA